ncbi:MAG TPA: hypothetical protein VI997_11940 [Candidatus Thermoplasmatota archaeon]|nr:hypothetical protein [Candidatus Thermoplasmatota archaeon]
MTASLARGSAFDAPVTTTSSEAPAPADRRAFTGSPTTADAPDGKAMPAGPVGPGLARSRAVERTSARNAGSDVVGATDHASAAGRQTWGVLMPVPLSRP